MCICIKEVEDYLDDGSDPKTASSSVSTDDGGERPCTYLVPQVNMVSCICH